MSLLGKLAEARAELDARHEDPWRRKVQAAVRDKEAICTAALLDLLHVSATTATARHLSAVMRSLHFIPIKSRRLMPGGRAGNTVTRGWARPVRAMKSSPTICNRRRSRLKATRDDPMIYQLKTHDQGHHIMHIETGECAGYLEPLKNSSGFIVHRALALGNEREKIAVIKSVDEAVPTLAAYYEKNPPQWKGGAKARRYIKWTFHGVLTVERQGSREWTAELSGDILVRDGEEAIFATSDEAKRVADTHMRDGFGNSGPVHDGFSWDDRLTRLQ
jgi:hypothetical protein